MDNLDSNPFYKALVSRFKKQLNLASKKCYIIAIPQSGSLQDVTIDEFVINSHILMPSKLLKAHFLPIQGGATDDIEIDRSKLIVQSKNDSSSIVRILREEIGVNSENKHYRILIIDKPLLPILAKKTFSLSRKNVDLENNELLRNHDECHQFLEKISHSITSNLEQSVRKLQSTYIILPKYLDEASGRIKDLVNYFSELYIAQAFKSRLTTHNRPIEELILLAVETYLVHLLHGKLVAAIYEHYSSDDQKVALNCAQILRSKLSVIDLGAQKAFKDFDKTRAILSQLGRISYLQSPLSIVSSLMQLINMISDQLNKCVNLVNLMNQNNGEKICICSDDLIASLVYSVAESQPVNFFSSLKYVELFGWSSCSKDQSAYCLATFQIVANYILSYKPPSSRNISNLSHLSLSNGPSKILSNSLRDWKIDPYTLSAPAKYDSTKIFNDLYENISKRSDLNSKQTPKSTKAPNDVRLMSPFERELEKITSIVETNSTPTNRKECFKQDDDLGELLSKIGHQSYLVSYGRQK